MGSTADLRTGAVCKFNGENCAIISFQHIKPGKGGAFYQVKMRNIKTGRVVENRFRSGESMEFVRVEKRKFQYLYPDGDMLMMMDGDSFEQIPIERNVIGDSAKFLRENDEVSISFEGDQVLAAELPLQVNLTVTHTEPGHRGDTATNVTKPATVETGAEVLVPIFINEGDVIRIDTENGNYIERVKK
jgi:elongation factor P